MTADTGLGLGPWTQRPLTDIAQHAEPFWEGLTRHEFLIPRCRLCGSWFWPVTICPHHDAIPDLDDTQWAVASGRGRVFAFVVVHYVMDPAFAGEVPYVLAHIELDEGPLFQGRLVGCVPSDVEIGRAVHIHFLDVPQTGVTYPVFTLAVDEG